MCDLLAHLVQDLSDLDPTNRTPVAESVVETDRLTLDPLRVVSQVLTFNFK